MFSNLIKELVISANVNSNHQDVPKDRTAFAVFMVLLFSLIFLLSEISSSLLDEVVVEYFI